MDEGGDLAVAVGGGGAREGVVWVCLEVALTGGEVGGEEGDVLGRQEEAEVGEVRTADGGGERRRHARGASVSDLTSPVSRDYAGVGKTR